MPQRPQERAKEKRRLTKRLANWRAEKAQESATPAKDVAKPATPAKAAAPAKPAAPPRPTTAVKKA